MMAYSYIGPKIERDAVTAYIWQWTLISSAPNDKEFSGTGMFCLEISNS